MSLFADGSLSTFHPFLIGLMGVISCILIFLFYYFLIRKYLSTFYLPLFRVRSQPTLTTDNNSSSTIYYPSLHYQTRGLDFSILRSLPVIQFLNIYREIIQSSGGGCAICLREFQEGEWVRLLPDCSHIFHVSCTDAWFQTCSTCPLCQSEVVNDLSDQREYSVSMFAVMETLRREDAHRDAAHGYNIVETEVTQVWHIPVRPDRL